MFVQAEFKRSTSFSYIYFSTSFTFNLIDCSIIVTNNVLSDRNTYGETNMSSYAKACEKVKEVVTG